MLHLSLIKGKLIFLRKARLLVLEVDGSGLLNSKVSLIGYSRGANLPANVYMNVGGGMTMTFDGSKQENAYAAKDS